MNVKYRKGTIEDCKDVYHLICDLECKQLYYEKFSEIYQRQVANENYCCLVCEYDNSVIGVLNLRFEEQLHHSERIAEIMEFVVNWSYRKIGIGKEMLARACLIAKDAGCVQIEVACNQLRTEAHRFYLRENMKSYHYKFSKSLTGEDTFGNVIGR